MQTVLVELETGRIRIFLAMIDPPRMRSTAVWVSLLAGITYNFKIYFEKFSTIILIFIIIVLKLLLSSLEGSGCAL